MTTKLTVAQALVRFLSQQYTERDGARHRLFAGCFGIFGHGNLAGIGQALRQYPDLLPYHQCRNEQAMVHTAAAYAKMTDRLSTFACRRPAQAVARHRSEAVPRRVRVLMHGL